MGNTIIVPWALGKDMNILITPQAVSTLGVLTTAALGRQILFGRIDHADSDAMWQVDNISPMSFPTRNPVPVEYGSTYNISEIVAALPLVSAADQTVVSYKGNVLRACHAASLYHKIEIVLVEKDGTTVVERETAYCVMATPRRIGYYKGKAVYGAMFQTITVFDDAAAGTLLANPAFTYV